MAARYSPLTTFIHYCWLRILLPRIFYLWIVNHNKDYLIIKCQMLNILFYFSISLYSINLTSFSNFRIVVRKLEEPYPEYRPEKSCEISRSKNSEIFNVQTKNTRFVQICYINMKYQEIPRNELIVNVDKLMSYWFHFNINVQILYKLLLFNFHWNAQKLFMPFPFFPHSNDTWGTTEH